MSTPTIDELVDYLADTKQYSVLASVQNKLAYSAEPMEFYEELLNFYYTSDVQPPSVIVQIESPDFSFWQAVACATSSQGFWPSTVLQEV